MEKVYLFLVTLVFFISCESDELTSKIKAKPINNVRLKTLSTKKEKILKDFRFNDFATFISGNAVSTKSPLKGIEDTEIWKTFQSDINDLWKKTNKKLPVISEWRDKELNNVDENSGTLFYPFSGADFLHADLFFPNHDSIVLIGLEPAGNFPDLLQKYQKKELEPYLVKLKKSMNAILGLSFFRTIAMADDFQTELDGTFHVLMHFIRRTGHEVLNYEKVAILPSGKLTTDLNKIEDSSYIGNRYYFKKNKEDKIKVLTYFSANLQNTAYTSRGGLYAQGLNTRLDLKSYINGLNINATYLKSASYLLHSASFSTIRNIILSKSKNILQDDSGIPIKYFETEKWDLVFYGNYIKPITLFNERHQPALADIYKNKLKKVKNLPFGIGYQFVKGTSNLIKAKKR